MSDDYKMLFQKWGSELTEVKEKKLLGAKVLSGELASI